MANEVYANGREISCKAADGKSIAAFPDTCLSPPPPPTGPVPLPYPNTAKADDTTDGSKSVKISGQEVMLKDASFFKTSMGDEAATKAQGMGVVTHQIQGKAYFTSWSMDVKIEGENAVRHLDLTTHNHASQPANSPPMAYVDGQAPPASSDESRCPPHEWKEVSRQTPEETKQKNSEKAQNLASKPSKASEARGPEFENAAIDANMEKLEIEATAVVYKCEICGAQQEVDIKGKDRLAEAKSKKDKGWKNAAEQHKNYADLQKMLYGGGKPLAKADGSKLSDVPGFEQRMSRRGFGTEIL